MPITIRSLCTYLDCAQRLNLKVKECIARAQEKPSTVNAYKIGLEAVEDTVKSFHQALDPRYESGEAKKRGLDSGCP